MKYLKHFENYIFESDYTDQKYTDRAQKIFKKVRNALKNGEYKKMSSDNGYIIHGEDIDPSINDLVFAFVHPSHDILNQGVVNKIENFVTNYSLGVLKDGRYIIICGNLIEPNSDKYIDTRLNKDLFVHEFIHYLDKKRYGKSKKNTKTIDLSIEDYYNTPEEFNAYYQEGAYGLRNFFKKNGHVPDDIKKEKIKDFETFKNVALRFFDEHFIKGLNKKFKKKFNKRLAGLYNRVANQYEQELVESDIFFDDNYPKILDERFDFGNVLAVIHDNWNGLENALNKYEYPEHIIQKLKKDIGDNIFPVAILKNINVDENQRGQGIGKEYYEEYEFWAEENGANYSILVSDSAEKQQKGFDLDRWYEKMGYKKIGKLANNSVMIKKID